MEFGCEERGSGGGPRRGQLSIHLKWKHISSRKVCDRSG